VTPRDYNAAQLAAGALTTDHVTELVRHWQAGHGLTADGMAGPRTIASLAPAELDVVDHWLTGPGVTQIAAHPSWYGGARGQPRGIVAHYTATDVGTGIDMAQRRARRFGQDPDDRMASWHITIETDGSVIAMVPLDHVAWHAASATARAVPGLGPANPTTIGIELVGHGKAFPSAQVDSAGRVWRALVRHYGIAREHAMITHQSIDPSRRSDPGPVWMGDAARGVLARAYA
jgi:hypothetical protein